MQANCELSASFLDRIFQLSFNLNSRGTLSEVSGVLLESSILRIFEFYSARVAREFLMIFRELTRD